MYNTSACALIRIVCARSYRGNPMLERQLEMLLREGAKTKRNAEIMRDKARPTTARRAGEELEKSTEPAAIKNETTTEKSDAPAGKRRPAS